MELWEDGMIRGLVRYFEGMVPSLLLNLKSAKGKPKEGQITGVWKLFLALNREEGLLAFLTLNLLSSNSNYSPIVYLRSISHKKTPINISSLILAIQTLYAMGIKGYLLHSDNHFILTFAQVYKETHKSNMALNKQNSEKITYLLYLIERLCHFLIGIDAIYSIRLIRNLYLYSEAQVIEYEKQFGDVLKGTYQLYGQICSFFDCNQICAENIKRDVVKFPFNEAYSREIFYDYIVDKKFISNEEMIIIPALQKSLKVN